jgi:membrane-bound lytic murein transglycosylase D
MRWFWRARFQSGIVRGLSLLIILPTRAILASFVACGGLGVAANAWAFPPALLDTPDGAVLHISPFPTPEELEPSVRFWTDIFIRHDSNTVVIHDRFDLRVVWEVVEVPLSDEGTLDRSLFDKTVKARVADITERLRRLEKDRTPADDDDRVLLALAGGEDSERLAGSWQRIRTQRGIAGNFRRGLERSKQWLPAIAEILQREKLPVELMALPFIESTFNPLARSSAGAAGLWQLMPGTAKQFGLRVERDHDERLDVRKATEAAAKVLRQNYRLLETWPLAITGYNHGPYGVLRAVKKVGSRDLMVLIEGYDRETWGFASKNFYAEFIAALRLVRAEGHVELALGRTDPPDAAID